jgi:hypothetical protein
MRGYLDPTIKIKWIISLLPNPYVNQSDRTQNQCYYFLSLLSTQIVDYVLNSKIVERDILL